MAGAEYLDYDADFADCFTQGLLENVTSGHNESGAGGGFGYALSGCDYSKLGHFVGNMQKTQDVLKQPLYIGIVVTIYAFIIILGVLGNTLVVVTVAKTKQLWTATNIFIANLAVADIFVCVFDLPFNAYFQITGNWAFGRALCHVIPSAFAVVIYASTLTLTMIAVDRYILIIYPLRDRMSIKTAFLYVLVIAVISITVASPIAIFAQYEVHEQTFINYTFQLIMCREKWPEPSTLHRRMYTIITLIVQFFTPLIIIGILYALIFRRLRGRTQSKTTRKTKTTKMLVAVVVVFAVTWIPFHLFSIISEFRRDLVAGKYFKFADSLLRALAMSSSCINPLLYGWLNDNYRLAFLSIIKRPMSAPRGIHHEDTEDPRTMRKANSVSPMVKQYTKLSPPDKSRETEYTTLEEEAVPLKPLVTAGDGRCSELNGSTHHTHARSNGGCAMEDMAADV